MNEKLASAMAWTAKPVAIIALLLGAGAIGAGLTLAIEGGDGSPPDLEQAAFAQDGDHDDDAGDSHGDGDGDSEDRSHEGEERGPFGFGGPFGPGRGFDQDGQLPDGFDEFGEQLEEFGNCLEEDGVTPFGDSGPRARGDGPGFFFHREGPGFRFRFGPGGFGFGGDLDFERLQEALDACGDELPDELREPFEDRRDRFEDGEESDEADQPGTSR